jgi:hypothetical protein
MVLTLGLIEERFGGTVRYLTEHCGLEDDDLRRIQVVLTDSKSV